MRWTLFLALAIACACGGGRDSHGGADAGVNLDGNTTEAPGVGDPCDPEHVPLGGFQSSETYLETSSLQCSTRVCMVYELQGDTRCESGETCENPVDPSDDCEPAADNCKSQHVYCTCRCDAPAGSTASTCQCPGGYSCEEILELGGDDVRGSYCVKAATIKG